MENDRFAALIDCLHILRAHIHVVAVSPGFLGAMLRAKDAAQKDATVLIDGETGTGKEVVARTIHYWSPRASRPYRPVALGSMPEDLVDDELFGHERGAFTGASARRPGLLEENDGGTVLLDEVDALGPRGQVALLRLIEERTYSPLGGSGTRRANVRWLAATNAPLEHLVAEGRFREDLYFRLNVVRVRLPPLRERREDIPDLCAHFLEKHAPGEAIHLSAAALAWALAQPWRGNVRELENAIQRGLVSAHGDVIDVDHLLPDLPGPAAARSYHHLKEQMLLDFNRSYLQGLMADHQGNVTRAAQAAGLGRRQLQRLLHRHGGATTMAQAATNQPPPPAVAPSPTGIGPAVAREGCDNRSAPPPPRAAELHETTSPAEAESLARSLPIDRSDSGLYR
jgi:two-component system, NtrC family, response regulator GlrR